MPSTGTVPVFDQADRLAKALHHSGMSVQDMADELGVSRNTIGNYLSRRTKIPRPSLIVWALRTGVRLRWLETGELEHDEGPGGGGGEPTLGAHTIAR